MLNTKKIIDNHIGNMLELSISKNIKSVTISKVLNILLEIEESLEDVVIDGDALAKYFNKKNIKPL